MVVVGQEQHRVEEVFGGDLDVGEFPNFVLSYKNSLIVAAYFLGVGVLLVGRSRNVEVFVESDFVVVQDFDGRWIPPHVALFKTLDVFVPLLLCVAEYLLDLVMGFVGGRWTS